MKAKNSLKRSNSIQTQSGRIKASRTHAGNKAPSYASGETGSVNAGLRKAFLLKRSELTTRK